MTKICTYCKEEKELKDFPKGRNRCKLCQKKYQQQHYLNNYQHKKYLKNCIVCGTKFTPRSNRGICCSNICSTKNWTKNNPNYKKKINKETRRNWKQKNKKELNKKAKEYRKARYHTDIIFKIKERLRSRLYHALIKQSVLKTQKTLELLGCTPQELKEYLESKFQEGMSWDNYGKDGWHMDHIIPCDSFDLIIEEEQKKCFHYSNLQPLWAEDNLSKNNKLNWGKKE